MKGALEDSSKGKIFPMGRFYGKIAYDKNMYMDS